MILRNPILLHFFRCPFSSAGYYAQKIKKPFSFLKEDGFAYEDIERRRERATCVHGNTPDSMHRRNRHLVDHSGTCICYLTRSTGGAAYTVDYARRKGLHVINIAEE